MLPDPELQKNRTVVKVYANEILLLTRSFKVREERIYWMERMTETLKGIDNVYFELAYLYSQRKEPKYDTVKRYCELKKKGYLIEKTQRQEFITPKSFERPPAIYSNKNWV